MLASQKKWFWSCIGLLVGTLSYTPSQSQGCSDAGFCTMGAMRPDQNYNKRSDFKLRSVVVEQYRGKSTLSPVIHATTLSLNLSAGKKNTLQVKVPYLWVNGSLGNTQGSSDISLSITRNLVQNNRFDINATLGARIPTNGSRIANAKGSDFPMYYQTSLGSFDWVAGASLITRKWLLAVGYQQALTENANRFRYEEWREYPNQQYLREYPLATRLKRGTDIMIRIERNFRFANFSFNLGLLPIYRISKDRIFSESENKHVKVDKTVGSAISALGGFTYHLNTNQSLKFLHGRKITQREVNPDGLTRHALNTVSYQLKF